jgi:hypothetical protein
MQCPLCSSELGDKAYECPTCGATQVIQRSPAGVITAWVAMGGGVLWGLFWLLLLLMLVTKQSLAGFPWLVLILGTALVAGLLWYSRTTKRTVWVRFNK